MREERKETLQKLCLVFRNKLISAVQCPDRPSRGIAVLHGDIDSALL